MIVTRTFEGETQTETVGNSGIISGGGEVRLWSTPCVEFKIEAPHCAVEVLQDLTDRGDGTYSYYETSAIELKITPNAGYEVTEVALYLYDVYVVKGTYISASGTWVLYPEFLPSTILVSAKQEDASGESIRPYPDGRGTGRKSEGTGRIPDCSAAGGIRGRCLHFRHSF